MADPPRLEAGFPYPMSGDPESVFVNAAFLAIADPRTRRILELLQIAPMTERELQEHADLGEFEGTPTLDDLVAAGLVTATPHDQGTYCSLNRKGLTHVSAWLKTFDL